MTDDFIRKQEQQLHFLRRQIVEIESWSRMWSCCSCFIYPLTAGSEICHGYFWLCTWNSWTVRRLPFLRCTQVCISVALTFRQMHHSLRCLYSPASSWGSFGASFIFLFLCLVPFLRCWTRWLLWSGKMSSRCLSALEMLPTELPQSPLNCSVGETLNDVWCMRWGGTLQISFVAQTLRPKMSIWWFLKTFLQFTKDINTFSEGCTLSLSADENKVPCIYIILYV